MHHTKTKADIAVAYAIAKLTEQQWNVGVLITEHAKYDLLVEREREVLRVQVKYCTPKKGTLEVRIDNSWADKNGNHRTARKEGDYDVLAVFCPSNSEVYFLTEKDLNQCEHSVTLKLEKIFPNARNQHELRMAENYKELRACSLDV